MPCDEPASTRFFVPSYIAGLSKTNAFGMAVNPEYIMLNTAMIFTLNGHIL